MSAPGKSRKLEGREGGRVLTRAGSAWRPSALRLLRREGRFRFVPSDLWVIRSVGRVFFFAFVFVFPFSFWTGLSMLLSVLLNYLSPGHLMLALIILTNVSLDISK